MIRPLRRQVYNQLFGSANSEGGLTITNRIVVAVILISVVLAVLSTERAIVREYYDRFIIAEMAFGVLFLIEYVARVWSFADAPGPGGAWAKRWRFIRSPIGIIDLVVVIASLVPVLITHASILRIARLLRLAFLMQFGRFSLALKEIEKAVWERRYDLFVTMGLAFVLILLSATVLYWAEGDIQPEPFGSIPRAMYWSIITLTAVGYGDVVPVTVVGKLCTAVVALGSIALIAMPTGIIAAAFSDGMQRHYRQVETLRKTRDHHHE